MARPLESYVWACGPLCVGTSGLDEEIFAVGSDLDDSPLMKAERQRKRETIGRRYLQGHVPVILSARLLGPFDRNRGWVNPWRDRRPHIISRPRPRAKAKTAGNAADGINIISLRDIVPLDFSSEPGATSLKHDEDDNEQFDADDEIDDIDEDSNMLHHDNYQIGDKPSIIFDSKAPRQSEVQIELNGTMEQDSDDSEVLFKPRLTCGTKRKAETSESWLKGAHIFKRFRQQTLQHTTPTPVQSRLQSPSAKPTSAEEGGLDSHFGEDQGRYSGFTPLKSSGQPTPPSERTNSASSRISSKCHNLYADELSKVAIDVRFDLRQGDLDHAAQQGSFNYRKIKRTPAEREQNSVQRYDRAVSKMKKSPTTANRTDSLTRQCSKPNQSRDVLKRFRTLSAGFTDLPDKSQEYQHGTPLPASHVPNLDGLKPSRLPIYDKMDGCAVQHLDFEMEEHSPDQDSDLEDKDAKGILLEDALQNQLLSETLENHTHQTKPRKDFVSSKGPSSSNAEMREVTADFQGISRSEDTQSDLVSPNDDAMYSRVYEPQQSPWTVLYNRDSGSWSSSPEVPKDDKSSKPGSQWQVDEDVNSDIKGYQQSPWAGVDLSLAAPHCSLDVASQLVLQADAIVEYTSSNSSPSNDILPDGAAITVPLDLQAPETSLFDPFISTQDMVDAATANPWTGPAMKQRGRGPKKRVSWVTLPSDDWSSGQPASPSLRSQRRISPPPPAGSLVSKDPKDPFHLVFKVAEKQILARTSLRPRPLRYQARDSLGHLIAENPTQNSPATDAMAKAFIAADKHASHENHDTICKILRKTAIISSSILQSPKQVDSTDRTDFREYSPASFSINPNGEVIAVGPRAAILDNDEDIGAAIDDMGSFLKGWDVDTELNKASARRTDERSSAGGWRRQNFVMGI